MPLQPLTFALTLALVLAPTHTLHPNPSLTVHVTMRNHNPYCITFALTLALVLAPTHTLALLFMQGDTHPMHNSVQVALKQHLFDKQRRAYNRRP